MRNKFVKWIGLLIVLALVFGAGWMVSRRIPARRTQSTSDMATPKQLWTCSMHPQVIREKPGECPICHMKLVPLNASLQSPASAPSTAPSGHRKIKYWWDPMLGPSSIRHHPGQSAMGMALVPVYEDEAATAGELTVDPAIVQNMGVRLAEVKRGPLSMTVRAAGYLTAAEPLRYDINLRLSGWIEKLSADTLGMPIAKGQKLFELYSPQLTVAVEELVAAKAAKASTASPGDPSSPAAQAADALYQSAKQKLRLWGLSSEQVDHLASLKTAPATIPFFSLADGVLAETTVVNGSAVQAGQRIMRIVDHRTLWLDAQIDPLDLPWIHLGQPAQASIAGVPRKISRGKVIFIDPNVDPATRTTTVRLAIDNKNLKLRPGMYATVRLSATPANDALLAPRSAIIDTGQRQVAFVAQGGGHFQPRDVKLGLVGSDGMAQILNGLSPGEQVVVTGQFLLDADSRMQEAVRRFLEK
jgi:Cu(I)/Ag(I) efflux system membrane fusion protein/cobalt-zinc-cadmium efflux system membrane fusion protein